LYDKPIVPNSINNINIKNNNNDIEFQVSLIEKQTVASLKRKLILVTLKDVKSDNMNSKNQKI